MKRRKLTFLLALCLILSLLTACQRAPDTERLGWDESWVLVGTTLGIEPPAGLTLLDNKDALAVEGLYYAAWTMGDSADFVNADGDTVPLYDAQLYLLLQDCTDAVKAAENLAEWRAHMDASYRCGEERAIVCAGQAFTLIEYEVTDPDNPYARGAAAFAIYQNHAICAELSAQDHADCDPAAVLEGFLNGIHYA